MKTVWAKVVLPQDEPGIARAMLMFKDGTKDLLTAGTIKEATYGERIKTLRHFVGWLHDNYHIPMLPRKTLRFARSTRQQDRPPARCSFRPFAPSGPTRTCG